MVGKSKGVMSLLQKHMKDLGIDSNIKLQFLIHQEALCTKVWSLKSVMDIVVKAVNLILSPGFLKPPSISPTTFTSREFVWRFALFLHSPLA